MKKTLMVILALVMALTLVMGSVSTVNAKKAFTIDSVVLDGTNGWNITYSWSGYNDVQRITMNVIETDDTIPSSDTGDNVVAYGEASLTEGQTSVVVNVPVWSYDKSWYTPSLTNIFVRAFLIKKDKSIAVIEQYY